MLLISLTWLFVQVRKGILSVVCGVCIVCLSGKHNPKTNMFAVAFLLPNGLCLRPKTISEFGPKCQKGGISVVVGALNLLTWQCREF